MGDFSGAAAEYRASLGINPNFAQAHYNLGLVLGRQSDFDEAIAAFREALRMEPGDPDVHNALGQALSAKGDLARALAEYREALRLRPDFFAAEVNRAKCTAELVIRYGRA
jgi:tetratricopeptide (TPR) repeat protein